MLDIFLLNLTDCVLEELELVRYLLFKITIATASKKILDFGIAKLL